MKRALLPLVAGPLLVAGPALAQAPVSDGPASDASTMSPLAALDEVAARVVQKVAPSVVLVEVERASYGPRQLTAAERAALGVNSPSHDPRYFSRPEGPCAGVAIEADLVATSLWNLEGDGAISVTLPDGRVLEGERLGHDENSRVGLVRVPGADLTPLPRADEEEPPVGRFVFLVGRAASNVPVVTRGIVSAVGRYRGDAFAHSARTSYATAGGAIVDLEGRLLGLSVRHADKARQAQNSGVGFGAPLGRVVPELGAMVQGEVIERRPTPFLGIQADIRATGGPGVRIARTIEGTAAEEAGLQGGDWIKIFNNVEIRSFGQLREEIRSLAIGTEIVITIVREEEEMDVRVKLGARVEDD